MQQDINYVMQNAPPSLRDYIYLALETGLRRCDLIKLTYDDIVIIKQQAFFSIKQSKTQKQIFIPISIDCYKWLVNRQNQSRYILLSYNGEPWHEDKFCHAWGRLKKRLKLEHITPHGLRKTTVTRLAVVGCSVMEISALLGWSLHTVQSMLDGHYYQDKISVALNALNKWTNDIKSYRHVDM